MLRGRRGLVSSLLTEAHRGLMLLSHLVSANDCDSVTKYNTNLSCRA